MIFILFRRGYKYSGSNNVGDVAWYSGNSGNATHPVGSKQANELGIYDMSGNVWEWCSDWYGSYSSGAQTNPTYDADLCTCEYNGTVAIHPALKPIRQDLQPALTACFAAAAGATLRGSVAFRIAANSRPTIATALSASA